jgi:hypothetical protein
MLQVYLSRLESIQLNQSPPETKITKVLQYMEKETIHGKKGGGYGTWFLKAGPAPLN